MCWVRQLPGGASHCTTCAAAWPRTLHALMLVALGRGCLRSCGAVGRPEHKMPMLLRCRWGCLSRVPDVVLRSARLLFALSRDLKIHPLLPCQAINQVYGTWTLGPPPRCHSRTHSRFGRNLVQDAGSPKGTATQRNLLHCARQSGEIKLCTHGPSNGDQRPSSSQNTKGAHAECSQWATSCELSTTPQRQIIRRHRSQPETKPRRLAHDPVQQGGAVGRGQQKTVSLSNQTKTRARPHPMRRRSTGSQRVTQHRSKASAKRRIPNLRRSP